MSWSVVKDTHHILFIKNRWKNGTCGKLRTFHYCTILIPRDTLHRYIHKHLKEIPVPGKIAAEEALKQLQMLDSVGVLHDDDPIEKRLRLLAALFDYSAQPTANALRKQLEVVHRFKTEPP